MNLQRANIEIYTKQKIIDIKRYAHFIDFGSEVSCYNLTPKQVIKFFDITPVDPEKKLLIADNLYGTNTYPFTDKIQKYCNKIISYTMKYVSGKRLGKESSLKLFYELSYNLLFEYIETLMKDSKTIANYGIEVFDCRENNIILSSTGFVQVDCIDFKLKDKEPEIIEKENIKLICQTIYDCLIAPHLSTFIKDNNLNPNDFTESPYEFIKEIKRISENYSDTEIITIGDTKKLSRIK